VTQENIRCQIFTAVSNSRNNCAGKTDQGKKPKKTCEIVGDLQQRIISPKSVFPAQSLCEFETAENI